MDGLTEAWRTNNRINLYLFDAITDEGMQCTLSTRGGRDVARQFAHMHDVRLYHLEKRAPDLLEGLEPFRSKEHPERTAVREALVASGDAVERFLSELEEPPEGKKRKAFKKGVATTLAYFVAHESHHRGSIVLTLKMSGHKVDQSIAYGLWDWDRR